MLAQQTFDRPLLAYPESIPNPNLRHRQGCIVQVHSPCARATRGADTHTPDATPRIPALHRLRAAGSIIMSNVL
jgi:hypothetical protein